MSIIESHETNRHRMMYCVGDTTTQHNAAKSVSHSIPSALVFHFLTRKIFFLLFIYTTFDYVNIQMTDRRLRFYSDFMMSQWSTIATQFTCANSPSFERTTTTWNIKWFGSCHSMRNIDRYREWSWSAALRIVFHYVNWLGGRMLSLSQTQRSKFANLKIRFVGLNLHKKKKCRRTQTH